MPIHAATLAHKKGCFYQFYEANIQRTCVFKCRWFSKKTLTEKNCVHILFEFAWGDLNIIPLMRLPYNNNYLILYILFIINNNILIIKDDKYKKNTHA